MPSRAELTAALSAAGSAHHTYESRVLGGRRDEHWAEWYAGFVLSSLGSDFLAPAQLAAILAGVQATDDWHAAAAGAILAHSERGAG